MLKQVTIWSVTQIVLKIAAKSASAESLEILFPNVLAQIFQNRSNIYLAGLVGGTTSTGNSYQGNTPRSLSSTFCQFGEPSSFNPGKAL